MSGFAQRTTLDEMAEVSHGRGKAVGERRHVPHSFGLGGIVHFGCFRVAHAERFFAHDMLTAADTGESDFFMSEIRRGDDDRIDVFVVGDLVKVGCVLRWTPFVLALIQELFVRIADRSQFATGIDTDPGDMMKIGNQTSSDDGDADFFVGHVDLSRIIEQ